MAIQKRKTISANVSKVRRRPAAEKVEQSAEEDSIEQVVTTDQEPEGEEPADEEVDEETKATEAEKETVNARRKELKSLYMDDLKILVSKSGLEAGKKEDMIISVLEHEAKERAASREQASRIRQVVVQKKQELEATAVLELKRLCSVAGIKGNLSKPERVEQLLKLWQEDNGVDRALTKAALDAREKELATMDTDALRKLCKRTGVSPFVKEVLVDRIVRQEADSGCFKRPEPPQDEEEESKSAKSSDVVEALLAKEANRKKEQELKQQQEEVAANTMKKLKALSLEELKTRVAERGREALGKKDDLVAILMDISKQDDAIAARKTKLNAMSIDDLKQLVATNGMTAGKKDFMVRALLTHEAKLRDDLRTYELKLEDVLAKKREELDELAPAELKDLCVNKGLKPGLGKDDRIERLLQAAKTDGEADKMMAAASREARKAELLTMEVDVLVDLCDQKLIDPVAKEIVLERVLAHEKEFGRSELDMPAAKRARSSRK